MKDRGPFFLVLSIVLHGIFILLFFDKIIHPEIEIDSTPFSDSLFYSMQYDSIIPDDSLFDEADFSGDLYYGTGSINQDQLYSLQSELMRYYDTKQANYSKSLIQKMLSGKVSDSLLAMNELLRKAALKQLLQQMYNNPGSVSAFDPESFSKWLKEILKDQTNANSNKQNTSNDMLNTIASDQELMKLWEQMVLKSIMEIGLDKLKKAMYEAICAAKNECFGKKPGDCPVSSFGNGGSFFGAEPDEKFLREIRKRFKELSGPYLSLLSSMMDPKQLEQFLISTVCMYSGNGNFGNAKLPGNITDKLDFAGLINDAISKRQRSAQQMKQFFDTFKNGLGNEITELLNAKELFDEEGKFAKNRIVEYADNYLKLLETLNESANLAMPDLEAYAKAALDIRNRKLKENGLYEIGRGLVALHDSEQFTIPEMVYIKNVSRNQTGAAKDTGLCSPSFFSHAWGGAPRAESAIIIDGNLNEWQNVYRYKLRGKRQGENPLPQELQSCNYLLAQWDNRGFYFAYEINDSYDNPCSPLEFWNSDALEMFFDPLNNKDSVRVRDRSYQFWVWPRLKHNWGQSGESIFLSPEQYEPRILKTNGIQVASQRNGNRYTCEVRVDPALMKQCVPLPGKIVGFNYSINNGEGVYIRWVTNKGINISGHPVLWGDLLLMGSNAQLKVLPEDMILPGQDIKIIIIDHDMNLSSGKQDRVIVKVRSKRTGDFLPCTCIETAVNSGVYSTSVGTTFGIDAKERQKLSVLPGDLLEIYYLDQHASGGQVNIPTRRFVQVGRGVFSFK
jgi:hypothetical protein